MQLFLHYKTQQIEGFLSKLSKLNGLYKNRSFQFEREFYGFVDALIKYFEQIGNASNQSEAERIRNLFQTASDGIDPIKLERVKTHRRTMIRSTAFHCLSLITEMLQNELQKDQVELQKALQTIGQLVLSLVQSGAITSEELSSELNEDQLKTIWHRLSQNEQVKLHERNLKLTVTQEDIFLLFAEVMEKIK